ncbi:MAG: hypothetical protein JNL74_04230, partial [Fibrobacteres bacterium]|nr:hypothetical protein [Fibrobacterota bacterium]
VALIEENGSPSLKDGKIQVLPGQTINFTYNDLSNAFGASVQKNILVTVAKTYIAPGGLTSGKTVWNAAGSPYWVGGNITINSNDTLEIQNGTRVMFRANKSQEWGQYGDTINVIGTLVANGLTGDSVYLGPNTSTPNPREWYGIRVSQYGNISLKYTKLVNAYYAVSFDYNYAYDTIVNRISHSLVKSAKTGVDYRNSQSPSIWLSIDSCKFESAPNDTGSVQLINAWYDWNTYGDSLVIKDNELIVHNGTVPNSSFTGIQMYGRKYGPGFKQAYILRNRISADTLVMSSYSRIGIGLDNFQASFVQNNRIVNFNEGIRAQDDSGSVISGNIFSGNKRHIQVNYGTAPRIDHNAFSNPPIGGSALWNNGSYDVDARNNYWGGPAT